VGAGGDMMAAHYRIARDSQGHKVLVAMSTSEIVLDKVLKFLEIDENGNKVCL
jgi:hypothetical protein